MGNGSWMVSFSFSNYVYIRKTLNQWFVIDFCCFRLFFTVFHVTDQNGNKLFDDDLAERIQQVDLQY